MIATRVIAPLLLIGATAMSAPATADAVPSTQVIAGRERIKVVLTGYPYPSHCLVDPDADGKTRSIALRPSGTLVVEGVASGTRRVMVWCPQGGVIYRGYVQVQPGNPVLDLQDRISASGSADRITDPALR